MSYNRGGCILIYVKCYFKLKMLNKISFSNNILDYITLELCIDKNTNIINAIYRATRYTNEAISELNNIILNNFNTFKNKKMIICIDLYFDIIKTDNLNLYKFINTINEIGCFKTITIQQE